MATTVTCPNPECTQYNIPKDNPADFPTAEIRCGVCWSPAADVVAAEPSQQEAPADE